EPEGIAKARNQDVVKIDPKRPQEKEAGDESERNQEPPLRKGNGSVCWACLRFTRHQLGLRSKSGRGARTRRPQKGTARWCGSPGGKAGKARWRRFLPLWSSACQTVCGLR